LIDWLIWVRDGSEFEKWSREMEEKDHLEKLKRVEERRMR